LDDLDERLDALRRALAEQRPKGGFATLKGPPGVGRRHLVRALGAADDGAAIVQADDDPQSVAAAVEDLAEDEPAVVAFAFPGSPSEPTRDAVVEIARTRSVVVIATERWAHEDELVIHVPALGDAAAKALIRQRLERAGGPTLGPEADPALCRIVRVCDGRPRALLLAAEQLTVLSPPQLAAELERTPLGDHPVGQDLRAAADEVLASLSVEERRALARLAEIGGPFDLDAARAVLGGDPAVVPALLERAAGRSLMSVEHDPEVPRYRLETFVAARLTAEGDEDERRQAAALRDAHYVSFGIGAGRLFERTADQRARRWLESNREHFARIRARALSARPPEALPAVLTTLLELQYLLLRGDAEERLRTIEETESALSLDDAEGPLAIALGWMSLARSDASWILGDREGSQRALGKAEALAESTGDPSLGARAAWRRGAYRFHWEGDVEGAASDLLHAISRHREAGDDLIAARAAASLGLVHIDAGDWAAAEGVLLPALAAQERAGDPSWIGVTRTRMGLAMALRGDLEAAEEAMAEGDRELRASGNPRLMLEPLGARALVARVAGRPEDALEHLSEALELAATVRDDVQESTLRMELAVALEELGELDASGKELDRTIALSRGLGVPHFLALALAHRARLDGRQGRAEARDRLEAARSTLPVHREAIDGPLVETLAASTALLLGETVPAPPAIGRQSLRLLLARRAHDAILDGRVPTPALRIGPHARWFAPPNEARVDLDQKPLLCRILLALVDSAEADGAPLTLNDLFVAGWPGERALPKSVKSRVWVAVSTLRKLGLGDVLVSVDGGYQLRRDVPRQRFDSPN